MATNPQARTNGASPRDQHPASHAVPRGSSTIPRHPETSPRARASATASLSRLARRSHDQAAGPGDERFPKPDKRSHTRAANTPGSTNALSGAALTSDLPVATSVTRGVPVPPTMARGFLSARCRCRVADREMPVPRRKQVRRGRPRGGTRAAHQREPVRRTSTLRGSDSPAFDCPWSSQAGVRPSPAQTLVCPGRFGSRRGSGERPARRVDVCVADPPRYLQPEMHRSARLRALSPRRYRRRWRCRLDRARPGS